MSRSAAGTVPAGFAQAVASLRSQYPFQSLGLAVSGGLDSMVLLQLAHAWARQQDVPLSAFHVHHGLSPHADAWLAHCERACAALGVRFDARRVEVAKGKSGVEQAARKARYAALGEMCVAHGVPVLLTAHHLDDQAETVLLQLLRGSGPAGLSGMDAANRAAGLLGQPDLVMARPLLSIARGELEVYAREEGIAWVDDESNSDPRYARNALRHQVMPALAQAFPGFQQRFARSAAHAASAQRLLNELAQQDLAAALDGDALSLAVLRGLSVDRQYNLLRFWFGRRGVSLPSTAWLEELVAQAISAREGAQLLVTHPDCHFRRHRDLLYITPKLADLPGMRDADDIGVIHKEGQSFRWNGESVLDFPDYGGKLHFEPAGQGFEAGWLRSQPLCIDFRQGGERLKLAPNRPSRSLKAHSQASNIPAWERARLPIVTAKLDLLYAAGLGMDCRHFGSEGELIALRWQSCQ